MDEKRIAAALVLALGLAGCGRQEGPSSAGTPPDAPTGASAADGGRPVSVGTVRAERRDVDVHRETTGTVTALQSVEVRPQVSATIARVHFREGEFVKAGQLLFTLDAREQAAAVARARAQLQRDLAALADAERQLARSRELFAQGFVSRGAVDTNETQVQTQRAAVAATRAALQAEEVASSYARIVAPVAGRAGAVNVFPGTLVQPASPPPLVTITQLDPIAVSFSLPQRDLHDALQALRSGSGQVTAVLPEGRGTLQGRLAFVDNNIDLASGTVRAKAEFDNRDERLWPGAFVNVRLRVRTLAGAVVVPQAAIVQGARGRIVYVVDADQRAQARPVELLHPDGPDAVVNGVDAGERVVVEGRQNVRPGTRVVERAPAAPREGGMAAPAPRTADGPASAGERR